MERVWSNYLDWEDFKAGMYDSGFEGDEESTIEQCVKLLSSKDLGGFMEEVLGKWPICTAFNLTNSSSNRNAWLGRAVCCFHLSAPEYITRIAWFKVEISNRVQANRIASKVIDNWCKNYKSQKVSQLCLKII